MATSKVIADPQLKAILTASAAARDQTLALFDQLAAADPARPATATSDPALASARRRLHAELARLRAQGRAAAQGARRAKAATGAARAAVDTLHLQLRNLDYEQRHLRGEIRACAAHEHPYAQLPLVPREEFLALHPELEESDEHALMVARIEHERVEREELEAQRQALLKKKQKLIADNTKRKEELASLDDNLEKFIDAARPIQKTFEKEL